MTDALRVVGMVSVGGTAELLPPARVAQHAAEPHARPVQLEIRPGLMAQAGGLREHVRRTVSSRWVEGLGRPEWAAALAREVGRPLRVRGAERPDTVWLPAPVEGEQWSEECEAGEPALVLRRAPAAWWRRTVKRTMDLALCFGALLVLLPLLAA